MDMSEQGLWRKLRKMRSLLKFTPPDNIGLHHRSFLEFLRDPSRSGQYNTSIEGAVKQQLVLVIASIVRAAEQAFYQPNYHPPVSDDQISRPLLKFQDRLLHLPDIVPRNECTVFHIVHDLLEQFSYIWDRDKYNIPAVTLGLVRHPLEAFSSLLRRIKGTFDLTITLISGQPEVVATKVHSWSEAQNLMDLTYDCLVLSGKYLPTLLWGEDIARKAIQLIFEIHSRVPVLPQFIDLANWAFSPYYVLNYGELEAFSQVLLVGKLLDPRYVLAVSRISYHGCGNIASVTVECDANGLPIRAITSYMKEMMFIMLNLAKTIQYLHSMGFVLSDRIRQDDIYVDLGCHVTVSPAAVVWLGHCPALQEVSRRYETGIYMFGSVFCMTYFGISESSCATSTAIRTSLTSLYKPESSISWDVSRLIQRCLSAEDKPTIDEVVQEMESWKVVS